MCLLSPLVYLDYVNESFCDLHPASFPLVVDPVELVGSVVFFYSGNIGTLLVAFVAINT